MTTWRDRPIEDFERPHLEALGDAVRSMQQRSGLGPTELCLGASISTQQFWRIVHGQRRTKRSTLGRLVAVAVEANSSLGPSDEALDRLCRLAGPALVMDVTGPVEIAPATEEEVRRRYDAWMKQDRRAMRARKHLEAVDRRYRRLHGDYARVQ